MLLTEMVRHGSRQFGDRIAVRFDQQDMTFAQTEQWADRIANAPIATGLAPGRKGGDGAVRPAGLSPPNRQCEV